MQFIYSAHLSINYRLVIIYGWFKCYKCDRKTMFPPHIDMKPLLIIITLAWRDEHAAKTVHENDAMIVLTFVFLLYDQ